MTRSTPVRALRPGNRVVDPPLGVVTSTRHASRGEWVFETDRSRPGTEWLLPEGSSVMVEEPEGPVVGV